MVCLIDIKWRRDGEKYWFCENIALSISGMLIQILSLYSIKFFGFHCLTTKKEQHKNPYIPCSIGEF